MADEALNITMKRQGDIAATAARHMSAIATEHKAR